MEREENQDVSSGEKKGSPKVRAVSRSISIIRAFTPEKPYLRLSEIANIADLNIATTRRLLATMMDEDLINQSKPSGFYSLSMQVLRWASAVPESKSLLTIAEPNLTALANRVNATVFLSVISEQQAVCLARYHGNRAVQVKWWSVGGTLPLNCGAGPQLLWAYQPADIRDRYLYNPMISITPLSIIDREELRSRLLKIKRKGWCYTQNDVVEGLAALAAPIHDSTGRVIAAVSLGGLLLTIPNPEDDPSCSSILIDLLDCCRDISHNLHQEKFVAL